MGDHKTGSCCTRGEGNLPVVNRGCCGGKDFGPVRDEECVQGTDVAAFSKRVMVSCAGCGARVCDEDEWCASCGARVHGELAESKGVPLAAAIGVVVAVGAAAVAIMLI